MPNTGLSGDPYRRGTPDHGRGVKPIQARGLRCAGIVLNQLEDEMDTAMVTNKGIIEALAGVPLLAHLIHAQDFLSLPQNSVFDEDERIKHGDRN